jgi:hypothetical protein
MRRFSFTEHPASVGETYFQHLGSASGFGSHMIIAGLACLVHGFFPFVFTNNGSRAVIDLHTKMVENRRKTVGAISSKRVNTVSRPKEERK